MIDKVQTFEDVFNMIDVRMDERGMSLSEALKSVHEEEDLNDYYSLRIGQWYLEAIKPPSMVTGVGEAVTYGIGEEGRGE